jgi:hypothetical protein
MRHSWNRSDNRQTSGGFVDGYGPSECCIWEAADPYLYIRTTPEGPVICGGGEDAEFSDPKGLVGTTKGVHYVIASSGTLNEGLRRPARYSSIVNEGIKLTYFQTERIGIAFDYVGVSRHLDRHQIPC